MMRLYIGQTPGNEVSNAVSFLAADIHHQLNVHSSKYFDGVVNVNDLSDLLVDDFG